MKKGYRHLNQEERDQIAVLVNRKETLRDIAKELNRDVSTISREIERNFGLKRYRPNQAQQRAVDRHHQAHKRERLKSHALRIEVEKRLREGWSPEIIAGRLPQEHPALPSITPEGIYQWIYEEAPHLIPCLVRQHPKRWPKGKSRRKRKLSIPNRVSIQQRPALINSRQQPGHWETDLLIGKGTNVIQVSVERQSRFTRLHKLHRKTALASRLALSSSLSIFPPHMRRSITYDNGFENMEHQLLNAHLGTVSYFCEPFHSWEKGTVENTNGLIRRHLPKKTNFDTLSEAQISQVESWLNARPRKCLNFKTPAESFSASVALTG
jgi:IS30 family transposase